MSSETKPIFFYGSLRDAMLLDIVLGRSVKSVDFTPAWAKGYATRMMARERYPLLVPAPGHSAEGMLLHHPSNEDIDRLTFFEEAEYALTEITAETDTGPVTAWFFQGTGKMPGTELPWDFDAWTREDRSVALLAAQDYMSHFGKLTIEEVDLLWPEIMARAEASAKKG